MEPKNGKREGKRKGVVTETKERNWRAPVGEALVALWIAWLIPQGAGKEAARLQANETNTFMDIQKVHW